MTSSPVKSYEEDGDEDPGDLLHDDVGRVRRCGSSYSGKYLISQRPLLLAKWGEAFVRKYQLNTQFSQSSRHLPFGPNLSLKINHKNILVFQLRTAQNIFMLYPGGYFKFTLFRPHNLGFTQTWSKLFIENVSIQFVTELWGWRLSSRFRTSYFLWAQTLVLGLVLGLVPALLLIRGQNLIRKLSVIYLLSDKLSLPATITVWKDFPD